MFSPFKDANGSPKQLEDLVYADFEQLADCDEGYVLEYKRWFGPTVQKKVPKIVASFSNSSGGWLVIGISDDKQLCPVPRLEADYSQVIGEICRRHVSPPPKVDVRFVADPADPDQGIVAVRVPEGDFPPYVADGIVEVREGSTSGPATSAALVELYGKATKRRAEVAAFCRRTVFCPRPDVPMFDLYLFNMAARSSDGFSRERINAHAETMRSCFEQQGLACRVQHAHDSLIFSLPRGGGVSVPHSAIELFPDESMKLSVPAVLLSGEERRRVAAVLAEEGEQDALRIMSAEGTLARVTRMASLLDRYVRARGSGWSTYAVAYELENMAGVLLWSEDGLYRAYVDRHGPLLCATTDCLSRIRYLDDGEHDAFRARQFAGSHFFEACGLPLGSPNPEDAALVDALLRTSKGAAR